MGATNIFFFAAYFTYGDHNIIIVDYSTLAKEPCLSQVEWAPRFGAQCIAQLVEYLAGHPRGVQPHQLHLIGYSVGAHIAGLTANYLNFGKLGRITGKLVHLFKYLSRETFKHSSSHFHRQRAGSFIQSNIYSFVFYPAI